MILNKKHAKTQSEIALDAIVKNMLKGIGFDIQKRREAAKKI